jgi:hypothetical protein
MTCPHVDWFSTMVTADDTRKRMTDAERAVAYISDHVPC